MVNVGLSCVTVLLGLGRGVLVMSAAEAGDSLLHCFRELHEVIKKKQSNGELKGLGGFTSTCASSVFYPMG